MPTELAVDDVRAMIAEAPNPVAGVDKVLALSGCWLPTHLVQAIVDTLSAAPTQVHVGRLRESLQMWRNERYRPSIERNLRTLVLRDVDRDGYAFAGAPVQTVHHVADMQPMILADAPSYNEPLTDEQIAELPQNAWVEIRLTVPTRPIGVPAEESPAAVGG